MATAGSIVIDLLAKTGSFETDMNRARKKVTEFDNDLKGMIARLDRASVAIAGVAAAAAGGWVALTMQTVKAMDATAKMAQQIGVTTESLTSLRFAAQQFANVSDQTFDMALRRMTRRIEEAAQGSGGAKAAFEAMGLSAKELARLSPDQQFMRIADAMQKTDTQAQRLKNTMAIFDTEGMPLVNALSQGSKELERNIELATRYGVVLSTEAARSAEQLTDNLSRLSSIQDGMRQQLTTAMLPALERLSGYMLGVAESALEVGNSRHRLEEFSRVAVEFVDDLARSYAGLTVIGRGVLDMLAELDDAALGWLEPFKVETRSAATVLTQSFSESILNTAREIDKLVGLAGGVMAVWETVGDNIPLYFRVAWNKVLEGAAAFVNSLSDLVNPMLETMGMDGFGKVAWGENVVVGLRSISESFREGYESAKAASGMAERVQTAFDGVAVSAAKTAQAVDGSTGGLAGNRKASEAARKAAEAFRKEQERALVAHYQSISAIHAQAQGIEDQVALFGQSKSALEDLTIARLEEEAVVLRMYGDRSKAAVEAIEAEIEARKRLRTAIGSLEQKEAEKAAWQSWAQDVNTIFDQVGQSLTDAIFDGGKSGLDLLKDWAKTLTLRIFVQPVMGAMQGWVTNQLGGMFGYSDPRQGGGSGMLGMAQNAYSGYNAATGGLSSTLGNAAQWLGQKVGSEALTSFGLGLSGTTAATGIASIGAGLGASLGTTIGTSAATMATTTFSASLGGAAAGSAAAGAAGAGAAIGAALPWIGGGLAIASLLGGGLFDREPTTRREQRTQVEYSGGSLGVTKTDDRAQAGADQAVAQMTAAAIQSANTLFQQIGVDAAIDSFHSIMASSYAGDRDGVASGGRLRLGDQLIDFGIADDENPTIKGFGGWSSVDPMSRIGTEISLSVLEAFQAVGDQLPSVLSDMLGTESLRGLNEGQIQEITQRFAAVVEGTNAFLHAAEQLPFANLRDLSFDAAAGLVELAGGVENLLTAEQSYIQNYLTEAERTQLVWDEIGRVLGDVNIAVPETRDQLHAIKTSLDLSTESGREAYAAIMSVQEAFASLTPSADELAAAAQRAADEQRKYQLQAAGEQWSIVTAAGEAAYSALARAVAAEKTKLQREAEAIATALRDSISAASSTVSELTSLTNRLTSTVQRMVGQGLDAGRNREWAQARIERALSVAKLTGIMPSGDEFEHALQIVAQPSQGLFDSFEDYQADFLRTAHDINSLNDLAGAQLTTEQRTLESLQAQLTHSQEWYQAEVARLDEMLEYQRQQLDMAKGEHEALLSIPAALAGIASAISSIQITAAATNYGGGGGGGGNSYYDAKLAQLQSIGSTHGGIDWTKASTADLAAYFAQEGLTPQEHWEKWGKNEGLARPSFAVGTNYVPYDMVAQIHEGERIIPAADNRALMQAILGSRSQDNEVRLLRQELREMKLMQQRLLDEIAQNTYDTSRTNREMTETPQPVRVTNVVPTVEATIGS